MGEMQKYITRENCALESLVYHLMHRFSQIKKVRDVLDDKPNVEELSEIVGNIVQSDT
jgi:hypothetical protein